MFKSQGVNIPRVSYDQAGFFQEVDKKQSKVGDMVFFKVNSPRVNHVGVISKKLPDGTLIFLHASSSKGVLEDILNGNYWKSKWVKTTRVPENF